MNLQLQAQAILEMRRRGILPELVRDGVDGLLVLDLPPEEAYGEPNPDLIFDVPIAPSQSDVAVGDVVFVNNSQRAVVIAIDGSTATVDANHELAGTTLTFEIELLAIIRG